MSQGQRQLVLDRNTIIVSETNEKGQIIYANEDFCKIANYTKDELIGKPHSIVRHPDMPKEAFHDLWQTISDGKIWKGIVKNRTKDGNYYWVNATIYPSREVNGGIKYISVRVRPTQDEIEKAQKYYATLK
jgi:aerotaxis receptor